MTTQGISTHCLRSPADMTDSVRITGAQFSWYQRRCSGLTGCGYPQQTPQGSGLSSSSTRLSALRWRQEKRQSWEELSLKTLRTVGTGTGVGEVMTLCFQLKGEAQGG